LRLCDALVTWPALLVAEADGRRYQGEYAGHDEGSKAPQQPGDEDAPERLRFLLLCCIDALYGRPRGLVAGGFCLSGAVPECQVVRNLQKRVAVRRSLPRFGCAIRKLD